MIDELVAIVGAEHVVTSTDGVRPYLADITEHRPGRADVVVRPASSDEVVAVVAAAAISGTPITPIVAGYNVAGIAIPRDGGIVLDLGRLTGIEVDRDAMVVIVEPGVTFEQLKAHLDRECPELVYTYPFAPPFTSVMANALLDGLNNLSMRHGAMGKWITGVEAVLADGTVVRTGSGAVVDSWFGRAAARSHGTVRVDARHDGHRASCRSRARAAPGSPSALVRIRVVVGRRVHRDARARAPDRSTTSV